MNHINKGRFKPGTSGNPSGRPAGSRNKATMAMEQMLDGEAENVFRKCLELAKKGHIGALRLCMERMFPVLKERPIELNFRPVHTAQELPGALEEIVAAVAEGRITPGEGEAITGILSSQARLLEHVDLDRRIQ